MSDESPNGASCQCPCCSECNFNWEPSKAETGLKGRVQIQKEEKRDLLPNCVCVCVCVCLSACVCVTACVYVCLIKRLQEHRPHCFMYSTKVICVICEN